MLYVMVAVRNALPITQPSPNKTPPPTPSPPPNALPDGTSQRCPSPIHSSTTSSPPDVGPLSISHRRHTHPTQPIGGDGHRPLCMCWRGGHTCGGGILRRGWVLLRVVLRSWWMRCGGGVSGQSPTIQRPIVDTVCTHRPLFLMHPPSNGHSGTNWTRPRTRAVLHPGGGIGGNGRRQEAVVSSCGYRVSKNECLWCRTWPTQDPTHAVRYSETPLDRLTAARCWTGGQRTGGHNTRVGPNGVHWWWCICEGGIDGWWGRTGRTGDGWSVSEKRA